MTPVKAGPASLDQPTPGPRSPHATPPQNKKEADPGVDRPNMNEMGRSKLEQDEEGGTPGELWVGLGVGVPFFTISIVLLVRNLYLNDRLRQYRQAVRVAAPGADCDDDGDGGVGAGAARRSVSETRRRRVSVAGGIATAGAARRHITWRCARPSATDVASLWVQ